VRQGGCVISTRVRVRSTRGIVVGILASLLILSSFVGTSAQGERPLLGARRTGLEVMGDTVLDVTLPSAFVLSGKILTDDPASVFRSLVLARSGDQVFSGGVMPSFSSSGLTATYRIVLPAGNYRLYCERHIFDFDNGEGAVLSVLLDLSQTVAITGNRTLDLPLPNVPQTVSLSGRIESAGRFPTKGVLFFHSSDGNVLAYAPFDGDYQARLLPGSYTVTAGIGDTEGEDYVQFRLGEVTVSASGRRDFTLPQAVELSGTVLRPAGRPANVLAIAAAEAANLAPNGGVPCQGGELMLNFSPRTWAMVGIPGESATGAYRLLLPPGTYLLSAGVGFDSEEAMLFFPVPPRERSLMADATQDFVMPELSPFVSLSGRITDERGQPVARASISAFSDALTDVPNAAFSASVEADAQGRYRLPLLRGTRYEITICPPVASPLPPGFRVRRPSPF
jgi:hypothetical protein